MSPYRGCSNKISTTKPDKASKWHILKSFLSGNLKRIKLRQEIHKFLVGVEDSQIRYKIIQVAFFSYDCDHWDYLKIQIHNYLIYPKQLEEWKKMPTVDATTGRRKLARPLPIASPNEYVLA